MELTEDMERKEPRKTRNTRKGWLSQRRKGRKVRKEEIEPRRRGERRGRSVRAAPRSQNCRDLRLSSLRLGIFA